MANHSATDPMAAATQSLMDAVQSYVRAAVASEVANGSSQAAGAKAASLKTQYDTALQENRELKDKIKKIQSKAEQEKKKDSFRTLMSNYSGIDFHEKCSRHSNSKAEFRQFKKLPLELRNKIWKLALPGGRIFELSGPDSHFHRIMRAAQTDPNQANPVATARVAAGLPDMCVTAHKTPKIRLACREANNAFLEAGSFEFGLFGGSYKGVWFNHAEDILYLRAEPTNWTNIDMSRVVRVAIPHTKLLNKDNCVAKIDVVLDHFTSCREVIMLQAVDWELRSCIPHPRMPAKLYHLRGDDIVGNHDYPMEMSTDLGNVVVWRDVKRIVEQLWREQVVDVRNLSEGRVPKLAGMEMLRARPGLFD
ncbi:hypothetical protein CPLU01_00587 [Colletotrichum plurivorum]|uniref:2EXR domain-containing protein n=1 Tax=Colletotrichum plurivorum TaxID=2175906 RepID=A0A8H6NRX2_9PEZI|nr:hypothetical protein CPLU01_00587 [Colletotrichum plurivorum]